jgi:hypothetical protein
MWVSLLHLLFGNTLIGIVEGCFIAWYLRCSFGRAVWIMILANYFSAWIGGLFLLTKLADSIDITISNLRIIFVALVVAAFLISVCLELPFALFAMRGGLKNWRKVLLGTVMANSISYPLMLGIYWWASGTTLLTSVDVVRPQTLNPPANFVLYYLDQSGTIMKSNLCGENSTQIKASAATERFSNLFALSGEPTGYDLYLYRRNYDQRHASPGKLEIVQSNFASYAPLSQYLTKAKIMENSDPSWASTGEVLQVRADSAWKYRTGFWAIDGISGYLEATNEHQWFSLETAFVSWSIRSAYHLKGDLLVFQLGEDQICLLNPSTRKISLVVRGRSPLVAVEEKPN